MLVGIDVVSIERVAGLVERNPRFARRVFTAGEQQDCAGRPQRWAATGAVKEAVRKLHASAGASLPAFAAVEVMRTPQRPPRVRVHDRDADIAVSISHDAGMATAVVTASHVD